jgi:hypothetical protein
MRSYLDELYENMALFTSWKQVAVSKKLIDYWNKEYNFTPRYPKYMIPCVLSSSHELQGNSQINVIRKKLGIMRDRIVFVYSGSTATWQNLDALCRWVEERLLSTDNYVFIFLCDETFEIKRLIQLFPEVVLNFKVKPYEVREFLLSCDYGLLMRSDSITNQVASPVKFAEYLSAGLKVIISPGIGDFSELVLKNDLGIVIDFNQPMPDLLKPNITEKKRLNHFASAYFNRQTYKSVYINIFNIDIVEITNNNCVI